jgi:Putative MetA-pathway of phenol degradation
MTRSGLLCIAIVLFMTAGSAAAQSGGPISTDRPSFSASPTVLSPGTWQIETGYLYTDGDDYNLQTIPQALLRFGLNDEIELQLGWPGLSRFESGGNSVSGMNDATFGVKIRMTDESASTPVAFLAGVSVPIGDDEFSSDSFDPMIGAAWSHSRYFGMATITYADSDYSFDNGVGARFAVGDRSSAFAEWHMTIPDGGGSIHRLNGGYLWTPQNNLQWDVNASLGLNDRAPDFSLGGGFSYRF